MFDRFANFLSPAALSTSTPFRAAAAASRMSRRTRSSLQSAPTMNVLPDADHHAPDVADEALGVDFSGQLLTPENSRSETSSNNELASGEEKPVVRRRSTRVTRASLRGLENLREMEENNGSESTIELKNRTVSGETLVDSIGEADASRPSSLRHNIAIIETSWSQTTLLRDNAKNDDLARCDTPVSKDSHESAGPSLRRRSLREQPEKVPTKSEKTDSEQKPALPTSKSEPSKPAPAPAPAPVPTRRSSRLSLLSKASDIIDRASSVLGKRSRDVMEKSKEALSRRASLRPRHSLLLKEEISAQSPAPKKRRVSESDLPAKTATKDTQEEGSEKLVPAVARYKLKCWLSNGLYTGQDRNMDPRLNEANNKIKAAKRNAPVEPQRKMLPLPMFSGERLLKNGRDFKLPFDIFSPLPPGQPKPDEWRKVNKNVFVGDAASFWRANKNVELSTCLCTEDTGCDENCQNRYMFYECDNGNCRLGANCGNRNFEELKHRTKAGGKYNIGVEVIKTMDRGYGVRSNRTFEPNQIIVEYTGEIITQGECERRMRTIYKNNECYYLMYFDQNMIIDATRGSIARFVNHSCEPNCRMEKWTVSGKPRMALFAGDRGIMTGEELTYDYNFDPFSQKNVQECRCGASTCRGVLGPRPKERERRSGEPKVDDKKNPKSQKKGTKRKIESVLDESTSRLNKKRKLLTTKSVKGSIKKVVAKARVSLSTKKGATVQTKKTSVSKAKTTARTKTKAKVGAGTGKAKPVGQIITKSKPKKIVKTSAKARARPNSKAKATIYQVKKSTKVTAAPSSTGEAVKVISASEKVKTKLKATARRSTSFKKLTKPVSVKTSITTPVKTPVSKTKANGAKKAPAKSPSRASSVKNAAKAAIRAVKPAKGE